MSDQVSKPTSKEEKETEEAFHEWVKKEDRHDGTFGNNNNFTRDIWVAERSFKAGYQAAMATGPKDSVHEQGEIRRQMTWKESSEMMRSFTDSMSKEIKELREKWREDQRLIRELEKYKRIVDEMHHVRGEK